MTERIRRRRRVQLAVPASSARMMEKAAASAADHVFLDLEDAVAPQEKVNARMQAVRALNTLEWGERTRCVRINDLGTKYAFQDVIDVVRGAGTMLDTIMIPKVTGARDVWFVDTLLSQLEAELGLTQCIGLEILVEEVDAVADIDAIAAASPRLEALIFGMGDYSASQGVDLRDAHGEDAYPGDIWHYARNRIVVAARRVGVDAIDGPFGNFRDDATYRKECRLAAMLGFDGKWAIHPAQIPHAIELFTPKAADVARARDIATAYREAEEKGLGATAHEGSLVDAATVRMVQRTIDKARLFGL